MAEDTTRLWNAWRTRRDARAFEDLVRPDMGRAVAFARAMGCPAEEAEDAVQESLVRLAGETGGEPARVGVRGWFFGIVRDRARAHLRADRRRRAREREAAVPEAVHPPEPGGELREQVDRALSLLPEEDREAVRLRFLMDLEYREVALVLGASEGACRVRVHRALGKLRSALGAGAAAILASIAFPAPARAATWVQSAVTAAPPVAGAALAGGTLVMTAAQKVLVAAAAAAVLGAAIGAGVESHLAAGEVAEVRDREAAGTALFQRQQDESRAEKESLRREVEGLRREKERLRVAPSVTGGTAKDSTKEAAGTSRPPEAPPGPAAPSPMAEEARALMAKWLEDAMQIQDPVKRTAAIAAIREALGSGEPVRVLAGLWAVEGMTQAGIDYDKASVRGLVVPQLDAADPVLRKAAMYALVSSGREPGDLDRLLRLRNDPSPVVRTEVTFIASQVARGELNGEVGAVVLAALDGVLEAEASRPREKQNSPDFRMFLARVNWRKPSPEIEDRLLALAKDPATRETVLNMVFQNMEKTPRVVDMLVELLDGPSILHQYIALRCLCYQVPESMAPRVAAILVKVLEARTADSTYWQWCLYGLRSFGTAAELPVLESLEGNEMIPEGRRKEAREAMDAIRKRQAK